MLCVERVLGTVGLGTVILGTVVLTVILCDSASEMAVVVSILVERIGVVVLTVGSSVYGYCWSGVLPGVSVGR